MSEVRISASDTPLIPFDEEARRNTEQTMDHARRVLDNNVNIAVARDCQREPQCYSVM